MSSSVYLTAALAASAARKECKETAVLGLCFWKIDDIRRRKGGRYPFPLTSEIEFPKRWYQLFLYDSTSFQMHRLGYATGYSLGQAKRYRTLWENTIQPELPKGLFQGQSVAGEFDFYEHDFAGEASVYDSETAISLRFRCFAWLLQDEKKRSAPDGPLYDFLYLQTPQAQQLDDISFTLLRHAVRFVVYAHFEKQKLDEFRQQWSRMESALLWHRLQTCLSGDPQRLMAFAIDQSAELYFTKPNAEYDSKMSDADDALDRKLREFDPKGSGEWIRVDFEALLDCVRYRRGVMHAGKVYIRAAERMDSLVASKFRTELQSILELDPIRQPMEFPRGSHQRLVFMWYWRASNQLFEMQTGGMPSSNEVLRKAGLNAMALLKQGLGVPPCMIQMRDQEHLENNERMAFSNFMFRLGASKEDLYRHWERGFRAYFVRYNRSVEVEMKSIKSSLKKAFEERKKYDYTCASLIKATVGGAGQSKDKQKPPMCPVAAAMLAEAKGDSSQFNPRSCMESCQRKLLQLNGSSSLPVAVHQQRPVWLTLAYVDIVLEKAAKAS